MAMVSSVGEDESRTVGDTVGDGLGVDVAVGDSSGVTVAVGDGWTAGCTVASKMTVHALDR